MAGLILNTTDQSGWILRQLRKLSGAPRKMLDVVVSSRIRNAEARHLHLQETRGARRGEIKILAIVPTEAGRCVRTRGRLPIKTVSGAMDP